MPNIHNDLLIIEQHTYTAEVAVDALVELLHEHCLRLPEDSPHRQFVRAVLSDSDYRETAPDYVDYLWRAGELTPPPERFDAVRSIARDGFDEQRPVEVFVDHSRVTYFHGHHRLATAIELGLPRLWVRFSTSSATVAALARELFDIYDGDFEFSTYQPIAHPYFAALPVHNVDAPEKLRLIVEQLYQRGVGLPVIDAGANLGYVSRQLARNGYTPVAVDFDPRLQRIDELQSQLGLGYVEYHHAMLHELLPQRFADDDAVLVMLGLFHHVLARRERCAWFDESIVPWMRKHCPLAFVEFSYRADYPLEGESTPCYRPILNDAEALALFDSHGYDGELLYRSPHSGRALFVFVRRSP